MSLPMAQATRPARRCRNAPPPRVRFADRTAARRFERMDGQGDRPERDTADDLLRRALIDPEASVAVALRVQGLALAEALTVVFHGRADLGTIQTYVAHGGRGAGQA